jgi:2-polyprenyl-3-methyl-5-hydroxy-6-metoxy-1,4-benzoquinol methylase
MHTRDFLSRIFHLTRSAVTPYEYGGRTLTSRTSPDIKNDFPKHSDKLRASKLFNQWWYYSIELMPGVITKGIYPADFPMLPRIMLRKCELGGMSCLDLGSMEGLIPALMCRGGAASVLATDAIDHCAEKMEAVKHYYNTAFGYRTVGLMYGLYEKLGNLNFDLINCSGLLYHVFSPLTVLSGIRPLLKRGGLMIISTNVVCEDGFSMEFNNAGRMQQDHNTFWYTSVEFLDYMLRYMKLAPIDCIFLPHTAIKSDVQYVFNKPSGYISVLCEAVDDILPTADDRWMTGSAKASWEYHGLSDWKKTKHQPKSRIKCKNPVSRKHFRDDTQSVNLWEAIRQDKPFLSAERESDSHILRLSDRS